MTSHDQPPRRRLPRRAISSPDAGPAQRGRRNAAGRRPSPLTEPLVDHRRAVATWALQQGESLRLDAITAILGAHQQATAESGAAPHTWTVAGVRTLLTRGAARWCLLHRMSPPPFLAESLCTYLGYLHAHGMLHADSDGFDELRSAAISAASLTRDGRRRMSATDAGSRAVHPTNPQRSLELSPAT